MKVTPNWKPLKLNKQCGVCTNYMPKIINGRLTARGTCRLTNIYKMRTESCSKYKEESEI